MRREGLRLPALIAAVAVFACLLMTASTALALEVSGTVRSAASGLGVAGLELQLWRYNPVDLAWQRPGIYAESASDGTYHLSFDGDGLYRVQCYNSDDFAEQWWLNAASPELATTITVPGSTLTGIDFSLVGPGPTVHTSRLSLSGPSSVYRYHTYKISGAIVSVPTPAVPAGGKVKIVFKRYYSHKWRQVGSSRYSTLTAGRFYYKYKPSTRGKWRAYVSYPGQTTASDVFQAAPTTYRSFTVK